MSKGYWVVRAEITDAEKFAEYAKHTPEALGKFGGQFLARAGRFKVAEGSTRSRNTIIEFPSYQAAIDCWNSTEYQDAKKHREGGGLLDIIILEGI